jgi:hypothetical protein
VVKGFADTTKTGGKVLLQIAQDTLLARLSGHRHAVLHYADGAGSYKTTAEFPIAALDRQGDAFLAVCGRRGGSASELGEPGGLPRSRGAAHES